MPESNGNGEVVPTTIGVGNTKLVVGVKTGCGVGVGCTLAMLIGTVLNTNPPVLEYAAKRKMYAPFGIVVVSHVPMVLPADGNCWLFEVMRVKVVGAAAVAYSRS